MAALSRDLGLGYGDDPRRREGPAHSATFGAGPAPAAVTFLEATGRPERRRAAIYGRCCASLWIGTDQRLARRVTVCVLSAGLPATGEVFSAARAAGRLADPRVARIYDADECCEYPYVVCERAPGRALADLISAEPPGPALAGAIITNAAEALALAHAAGRPHLCLTLRSGAMGRHHREDNRPWHRGCASRGQRATWPSPVGGGGGPGLAAK